MVGMVTRPANHSHVSIISLTNYRLTEPLTFSFLLETAARTSWKQYWWRADYPDEIINQNYRKSKNKTNCSIIALPDDDNPPLFVQLMAPRSAEALDTTSWSVIMNLHTFIACSVPFILIPSPFPSLLPSCSTLLNNDGPCWPWHNLTVFLWVANGQQASSLHWPLVHTEVNYGTWAAV